MAPQYRPSRWHCTLLRCFGAASASVGAPGVEHCARHASVQIYILSSTCLLAFCRLADFTAATYDSRLMASEEKRCVLQSAY
jgi:hypothetical protein